jgi:hypothetical protein
MPSPRVETMVLLCEVQSENERLYGRPFAHLRRLDREEGTLSGVFIDGFLIAGKMVAGRKYRLTIEDVTDEKETGP